VHILPGLVLSSNLNLHNISHDQQVIDDYRADPLTHGKASVKLGHELFRMHHTAYKSAPLIRLPLYIFHGTEDHLTSPRGSCRFFDCVSSPDKEIRLYEGLFHETINEIPIEKARVLRDLTDWIFRH
jgi:lysophospholipase